MVRPLDAPVEPAPPEATEWLIDELSKPEYVETQPGLLEIIGRALSEWFDSLFDATASGPVPFVWFLVAIGLVLAVVATAILIRGIPRLTRRSRLEAPLLGDDDTRDAARLRADAMASASRGQWELATIDMFRAIARGLAERELVAVTPGTTARELAMLATGPFPDERAALVAASQAFDAVRYLDHPGSLADFEAVASLEARIRATKPALEGMSA